MRRLALLALPLLLARSVTAAAEEPEPDWNRSINAYLTPEEARARIFPQAAQFSRQVRPIAPALWSRLARETGRPWPADSLEAWLAHGGKGEMLGYCLTTDQIGKYRPITFMVGVTPTFRVQDVAVLVYRESRGSEVHRTRFLRQYRGKSAADPIRLNRDIINITGATLSVRALNAGVRGVLVLVSQTYGGAPGEKGQEASP
ncbi:MAG: FMN-binding protein [Candidatus Latescibacterota bacterium]